MDVDTWGVKIDTWEKIINIFWSLTLVDLSWDAFTSVIYFLTEIFMSKVESTTLKRLRRRDFLHFWTKLS